MSGSMDAGERPVIPPKSIEEVRGLPRGFARRVNRPPHATGQTWPCKSVEHGRLPGPWRLLSGETMPGLIACRICAPAPALDRRPPHRTRDGLKEAAPKILTGLIVEKRSDDSAARIIAAILQLGYHLSRRSERAHRGMAEPVLRFEAAVKRVEPWSAE